MKDYESYTKIIAVDFDGTLAINQYPDIGLPNMAVIDRLKEEIAYGAKVILWTCRDGNALKEAVAACARWGLTFDAINDNLPVVKALYGSNPRKVTATEYWDDRGVNTTEWRRTV